MGAFQYGMLVEQVAVIATSGGTTSLSNTSKQIQYFTGTSAQTVVLPATTSMSIGQFFEIYNGSTGALTIQYQDATSFIPFPTIAADTSLIVKLVSVGTTNGTWVIQTGGGGGGASIAPVIATYFASVNQTPGAGVQINFDTQVIDTDTLVTTGASWKFTAPNTGYYLVCGNITLTTGACDVVVYKNGSSYAYLTEIYSGFNGSTYSVVVSANAGDTLDLRIDSGGTLQGGAFNGNGCYVSIAQFLPSGGGGSSLPSIGAKISGVVPSTPANNPWIFPTVIFDTNSAYNGSTGQYTIPVSGYYVVGGFFDSGVTNMGIQVYVNNTFNTLIGYTSTSNSSPGATIIKVNAGDLVDFRGQSTTSLDFDSSAFIMLIPNSVESSASPRSQVSVSTGNGNGSTNIKTRRFSSLNQNVGSNITYADSATLGGSFTVNAAGIYSISFSDAGNGPVVAIVVNDSAISTDPDSMTYAQGLRSIAEVATANQALTTSWTGILNPGDVVTAKSNGANTDSLGSTLFSICQVSN